MKKTLISLLIFCSVALYAQTQPKILTFEEAVKIALRNGVLLNQQKNNLELSAMQHTYAIAGLGPTVNINTSAQRVYGNTFIQQTGNVINGKVDNVQGSLNSNINLFNGFSQVNRVRQASAALEAQSFYVNRTTQDLINAIAGQYLQVLLDVELLTIANENWEALKKTLEQVKEQVTLGAKSPVDEYNQDSQTKAAEITALQAQINLVNDKALLTQTLLLDPNDEFDVIKPQWNISALSDETTDLAPQFETALKYRGDYLRALKNEESAKYGMKAFRASMLPTLSMYNTIYTTYNYVYSDVNKNFDEQVKNSNLRKFTGFQLTIPILGGYQNFQNRTNYVQQRITFLNNQWLRKNAEVQVKTDIKRANENFKLYSKTYTVSIDKLKAANLALQLETERYTLGITSFVDYANANRVFVQAQTDKAQAEYRLLFQKVLVDYARGTLKPEDFQ
ncbi:MAG: TolC family protein [Bacteroidetes bacterium]|nr:TolC family protein [Bacteroidota bacterium]